MTHGHLGDDGPSTPTARPTRLGPRCATLGPRREGTPVAEQLDVQENADGGFDVVRRGADGDEVLTTHPLRSGAESDLVRLAEAAERGELDDAGLDADETRPDNAGG
ncbi:hypothetical protein FTX61_09000 [Nitriliruptoraceae bacterium ZYF776]|nr:hypothetical protein [Profundirhabdus halotolerans]